MDLSPAGSKPELTPVDMHLQEERSTGLNHNLVSPHLIAAQRFPATDRFMNVLKCNARKTCHKCMPVLPERATGISIACYCI